MTHNSISAAIAVEIDFMVDVLALCNPQSESKPIYVYTCASNVSLQLHDNKRSINKTHDYEEIHKLLRQLQCHETSGVPRGLPM
jgi:hypothetical protein